MSRRTQGVRATEAATEHDEETKKKKSRAPLQIQRPTVPTELTTTMTQRLAGTATKSGTSTYDCMVCLSSVNKSDAIWQCHGCWAVFHIRCITKWAASQQQQLAEAAVPEVEALAWMLSQFRGSVAAAASPSPRHGSSPQPAQQHLAWRCPGCRALQSEPPAASCYCGKAATLPPQQQFNEPHSCGAQCGRKREGTSCPHSCTLVCHPGPCPPCPALGPLRTCHCGKRAYRLRCGEEDGGSSCGATCNKQLPCGRHRCTAVCHAGDCAPCAERIVQTCYCGTVTEPRPCTRVENDHFSCGNRCPKTLSCGNHRCPLDCHSGPCPDCKLLPDSVKTCPCGKTSLGTLLSTPRRSCTDEVPTCAEVCGKALAGCEHCCAATCHHGPCPQCVVRVSVRCRCGSSMQSMPCHEAVALAQRGEQVLCQRVCRVKRDCKKHICGERCCPSLSNPDDPSGMHICKLPCGQPLSCGKHSCELLCHTGPCSPCTKLEMDPLTCRCGQTVLMPPVPCGSSPPECMLPCRIPRPCGHADPPMFAHRCHFGECTPCVVLVSRMCAGGHEMWHNVLCHRTVVSCGRPCNKPLACGQHSCRVTCHPGQCQFPVTGSTAGTELKPGSCGQPCGKSRAGCGHPCKALCHPGEPCPMGPCTEKITVKCPCGRRSVQVDCLSVGDSPDGVRQLECDDECAALIRTRRLAQAFGIRPEGSSETPTYGDYMLQFASGHHDFVCSIERSLEKFLASDSRTLPLRTMDGPSRHFVQKLAKYYGLTASIEGQEPMRYVQLTKTSDARTPNVPISAAAAVSSSASSSSSSALPTAAAADEQSLVLKLSDKVNLDAAAIQQVLRPHSSHCQLVWLDRHNAFVVFQSESALRAVRASLLPLGIVEGGV